MFYFLCIPLLDLEGEAALSDFINVDACRDQTGYYLLRGFHTFQDVYTANLTLR